MNIVAYIDESATHKDSNLATIAGYVAPVEDWTRFTKEWATVLRKYTADYFHFSEWADAYAVARGRKPTSNFKENPYRHMDLKHLNSFILELAKIAGSGNKVIVGMNFNTEKFHQQKAMGDLSQDSSLYKECAEGFFDFFTKTIEIQKRVWKRMPVTFFFDRGDKEWMLAITAHYHHAAKTRPHFRGIGFWDKKKELPLQAADMVAYRSCQIAGNWIDDKVRANWAEFDAAVFKPFFDLLDANRTLRESGILAEGFLKAIYDSNSQK